MHIYQINASTYVLVTNEDPRYRSGSCELLQVILYLIGVAIGCDIDKFQKPLFEGQLTDELLSPSAVGAGWVDESVVEVETIIKISPTQSESLTPGIMVRPLKALLWPNTKAKVPLGSGPNTFVFNL